MAAKNWREGAERALPMLAFVVACGCANAAEGDNFISGRAPSSGGAPGGAPPNSTGGAAGSQGGAAGSQGGAAGSQGGDAGSQAGAAGSQGGAAGSQGGAAGSVGGDAGSQAGAGGSQGGSAGTGGSAGASGSGGSSGTGNQGTPPCLQDPSQLVMIGDSYVNWITHTFPTDMNAAAMLSIANFAVGGTSMGSGGLGLIPPQFDTALMTHPKIIAVIMDGGGNDILVPDVLQFPQGADCKAKGSAAPAIPDCQKIVDKALDAGTKLFFRMASAGVKDVVYFFYPRVPTGTWLAADPNGMLDYALPKIQAECDGAYARSLTESPGKPIRCHFVNMVPVFEGHPEYFADADLHPNPTGSKAMAAAIWAKMREECVAQPQSSGCCASN